MERLYQDNYGEVLLFIICVNYMNASN